MLGGYLTSKQNCNKIFKNYKNFLTFKIYIFDRLIMNYTSIFMYIQCKDEINVLHSFVAILDNSEISY